MRIKDLAKQITAVSLAACTALTMAACGSAGQKDDEVIIVEDAEKKVINLFSPMEKTEPDVENTARSAFDKTIIMAEEKLGVNVVYRTYTAEDYQDKTYDEVTLERARNNLDDLYLLNPDVIKNLGEEGLLLDLSDLSCADHLREVVKTANTVNGKLVAIPQEVVAYGLFVNQDMFDEYNLALPETPEEFLECCRVFKENGIETPVGANRWWLETFVFAQCFADMYNGGDTEAEAAKLNSGESKYSDYMRPGFEFLQEMIDKGYIDAKKAYVSEAIEGEGDDFLSQKTPIVMAYWGAANTETAYGKPDFHMQVIGFPSSHGQMPVVAVSGLGIGANAEHLQDAKDMLEVVLSDEALQVYSETNKVISPSKNVEVDCIPALKPLNDKLQDDVYVLAGNAGLKLEQWGNTCLIVRELLNGSTVDACMEMLDELQEESMNQ